MGSFRPSRLILVVYAAIGVATIAALRQQPLPNLGFESHDAQGRPTGWYIGGEGFEVVVDSAAPLAGRFSLRSRWTAPTAFRPQAGKFGVGTLSFPVARAAGRRLRFAGSIRTEKIDSGYAGLWMRVGGPDGQPLAFYNMAPHGVRGTTPWTRYQIELPVDSGATNIVFGIIHPGDGTAWFDSLTIDVVGDPMPRRVASFKPESRPAEDMTRLLSDAELALPADTAISAENPVYASWVAAHAHPIRSLGATDFSDLSVLAPVLEGKRVVQLGESGHGVAEFSMAKVRLIRYLHEQLGYDVIAFESSTYECDRAQKDVASLSALDLMRGCIFQVWHADEALRLFEYIKQTQATPHPLVLAGFDEQISTLTVSSRPRVFRSLIAPIDSAYAARVYTTDSTFIAASRRFPSAVNPARFSGFYDSLATFLRTNRRAIEAAHRDDPTLAIVARQAAVSMTYFVRQLAAGQSLASTEIRDLGMANNLDFLLDELHPGKKVIVWAHNFHIQRRGFGPAGRAMLVQQSAADTSQTPARTMGTWVAERHGRELYTIGLFMYRGSAAANDRQPYPIAPSPPGSLESILHRAPWRYAFVDFSRAKRVPGSEWIWSPIRSLSWGTSPETIVPRDEYDGVLFIDTVHLSHYR